MANPTVEYLYGDVVIAVSLAPKSKTIMLYMSLLKDYRGYGRMRLTEMFRTLNNTLLNLSDTMGRLFIVYIGLGTVVIN